MPEVEKHMPTSLKVASSVVTATVAILAAVWAVDQHYATAADLSELKQLNSRGIVELKYSVDTQIRAMRQERTEDEISRLTAKKEVQQGKLSPEDTAQYNRLLRRIRSNDEEQREADVKASRYLR